MTIIRAIYENCSFYIQKLSQVFKSQSREFKPHTGGRHYLNKYTNFIKEIQITK